jgi:hypothetical protein
MLDDRCCLYDFRGCRRNPDSRDDGGGDSQHWPSCWPIQPSGHCQELQFRSELVSRQTFFRRTLMEENATVVVGTTTEGENENFLFDWENRSGLSGQTTESC